MVWCGVVWCGVAWCGVVWCAWCGVAWCCVVWRGVVWCVLCNACPLHEPHMLHCDSHFPRNFARKNELYCINRSNKIGGKHMGPIWFAYSRPYVFFGSWHDVGMMSINATARIQRVIRAEMITKKYEYIS